MFEYGIGQQEALLGLSLYVLACKLDIRANYVPDTETSHRRSRTNALGTVERGRLHWQRADLRFYLCRFRRFQYTCCDYGLVGWFPCCTLPSSILWQPVSCHWRGFDARSLSSLDSPLLLNRLGSGCVLRSCSGATAGKLSSPCERVEMGHVGDGLACCTDYTTDVDITGNP
jgi:hypothetical protein